MALVESFSVGTSVTALATTRPVSAIRFLVIFIISILFSASISPKTSGCEHAGNSRRAERDGRFRTCSQEENIRNCILVNKNIELFLNGCKLLPMKEQTHDEICEKIVRLKVGTSFFVG